MSTSGLPAGLLEEARAPYRRGGRFAWHSRAASSRGDPAFRTILAQGLLQGRRQLLDLGCGQGLLAALAAGGAEQQQPRGPLAARLAGAARAATIRASRSTAQGGARAARARQRRAEIVHGDIRAQTTAPPMRS